MVKISIFSFVMALLAVVWSGCTEKGKAPGTTTEVHESRIIELQKVNEVILAGDLDAVQIGRLETPAFVVERAGQKNLVLYDSGLNQVLVADLSGTIIASMGSVGSGPEEFRHITSFGIDQDTIIVYDGALDKVKKFTFNGEFLDSYDGIIKDDLWSRSNRMFATEDGIFIGVQEAGKSSPGNHWESKIIAKYSRDWELQDLFGDYHPSLEGAPRLYNYANILQRKDGDIYTTHRTSYQIQRFDGETGELVSSFGTKSDFFKISDERPNINDPREVKNKINTKFSGVNDAFVSNDYLAFCFFNIKEEFWVTRDPNDQDYFIRLYDLEDRYVGDIVLPFYPLSMDDDNMLYLLEDDNPDNVTIGIYEILL